MGPRVASAKFLGKPWLRPDANIPREIEFPKGMLGSEERRALFWLTRETVTGEGQLIDCGSFLGTSAFAMAAGLAHAASPAARRARIHCYDVFEAFEEYVAEQVAQHFGGDVGTSFRDIFEYQLGKYLSHLVIHEGDLMKQKWTGEPIEILFIDLAKTRELHSHILQEFFPSLTPGKSLVLHQDFFLCRHPWIHATMEALSDHFETIDPIIKWCTRAYRLKSAIPPEKLARVCPYQLSTGEETSLLKRAKEREEPGPLADLFDLLIGASVLQAGRHDEARRILEGYAPQSGGDADLVRMLEFERAELLSYLPAAD